MWTEEIAVKNLDRVRDEVRRVYLQIWDPIRVQDEPNAQDEYDSYIDRMISLLVNRASDEQLKQYLDKCVAGMGMNGSAHSDNDVIEALRKIELVKTQ
jgi:hypothetical protein